jgi:hypothetical protein
MDVKRLQLWQERTATLISNDSMRVVIEDWGSSVVELSNITPQGGRLNAYPMFHFKSTGSSIASDVNSEYWQNRELLYHLGGSFFNFPNFGPEHHIGSTLHQEHGWTSHARWQCVKYGTDFELGANWVLYKTTNEDKDSPFTVYKIFMMIPSHPVLYSSVKIVNEGDAPLEANAAWHNTVGPPFLESGCVVNLSADLFSVHPQERYFDSMSRLKSGSEFDDLGKAPLKGDGVCDLREISGPIGFTDYVSGKIPRNEKLGWSSVVNPRHKMIYFTFFTGPGAAEENEIVLRFNNLWMQYGGRPFTPWALYDGGTDQTFCLGIHSSIGYYNCGLKDSLENKSLLDEPTTFTIEPKKSGVLRHATAFVPYENPKMDQGVQTVEQVVEGLVLKRGKAWAFIESDSIFHFLKELEKKILG